MTWRTIVIRERAKLDYCLNFMTVRKEAETKKVSLSEIYMVIVENTAVSLTAVLLNELIKNKIKIIFCDEKRNPNSELIPYYGSHDTSLKYKNQLSWSEDSKARIWTRIVYEKIYNQMQFLKNLNKEEHILLGTYLKELEYNEK
ncbi:type II CRISPR-associated endonuclease Cas1, partial [Gemella cuniculi]|uniref:type II CRISPR-associated endonuclease Cas1 n=1 Tax=Gemella cuniculi TaxID=150240 RepID=UPI00041E9468